MGPSYLDRWLNTKKYWVQSTWPWVKTDQSELMKYQYLRVSLPHDSVMMKNCNITCGNALYLSEGLHHLSKWNCRRNIINLIYSLFADGLELYNDCKNYQIFWRESICWTHFEEKYKNYISTNQSINTKIKMKWMSFLFSDI